MREVGQRALGVRPSGLADAALVARCREGDEEAWAALVERFSRYVYAICVQGFRLSRHDAEDVFQEVFARTYEHLERLRDPAAIRPWIAQLTRRLAIDRLRAEARAKPSAEAERALAFDEDMFARLDAAFAVHQALGGLPERCREVLDRFFCRDESYRTIGEVLEIPAGTIASRISRCLARLREALEGSSSSAPASRGR